MTPDGLVKLTDFGIACAVGLGVMTKSGEVMGTVQHFAIETAIGYETTTLTDIYSLAVVTYEILCGRRIFNVDSEVAFALQRDNEPLPTLPTLTMARRSLR